MYILLSKEMSNFIQVKIFMIDYIIIKIFDVIMKEKEKTKLFFINLIVKV